MNSFLRSAALFILTAALASAGCGGSGGAGGGPVPEEGTVVTKSAVLTGAEQVPPAVTSAGGSGVLGVNTTTGTASGSLSLQPLPAAAVIAAHVHQGVRGVNGAIIITLEDAGAGVWNVPAGNKLAAAQVNAFLAGELYFNVRTEAFPDGELRGQIDQ